MHMQHRHLHTYTIPSTPTPHRRRARHTPTHPPRPPTCRRWPLHTEGVPPAADVETGRGQGHDGRWQLHPVGQIWVVCCVSQMSAGVVRGRVRCAAPHMLHRRGQTRQGGIDRGDSDRTACSAARPPTLAPPHKHITPRSIATPTWISGHSCQLLLNKSCAGVVLLWGQAVCRHCLCVRLEVHAC